MERLRSVVVRLEIKSRILKQSWVLTALMLCVGCGGGEGRMRSLYLTQELGTPRNVTGCVRGSEGETWAVVIGVNEYQDQGVPPLKGASHDAWTMYHYLTNPKGGGVPSTRAKLLINEEATKSNVEEAFNAFLAQSCPQDQVLLYIASHGVPEPSNPDEAYLVMHDTQLDKLVSTGVSMTRLPQFLEWRAKASQGSNGRVVLLLDACHSGNVVFPGSRGFAPSKGSLREAEVKRASTVSASLKAGVGEESGWGVIAAAAPDQVAEEGVKSCLVDGKPYDGGIFTCSLLRAISRTGDKDQSGGLSFDELYQGTASHLRLLRGPAQVPQRSGGLKGSATIFKTPTERIPIPPLPTRYNQVYRSTYQPWIWTTVGLTAVALGVGIERQMSANQEASELNAWLSNTTTGKTEADFNAQVARRDEQASQSQAMYISAGVTALGAALLGYLEYRALPPPREAAYDEAPKLWLGTDEQKEGEHE